MPTQVGKRESERDRESNRAKLNSRNGNASVYFKLFFPHASRLECVKRVYFSHLISFCSPITRMVAAAVHIEIS